jgi:hypothetical protein
MIAFLLIFICANQSYGCNKTAPEEVFRRACLPQQAKLEVGSGRKLVAAGHIKPVLVEFAFSAVEV